MLKKSVIIFFKFYKLLWSSKSDTYRSKGSISCKIDFFQRENYIFSKKLQGVIWDTQQVEKYLIIMIESKSNDSTHLVYLICTFEK